MSLNLKHHIEISKDTRNPGACIMYEMNE